MVIALRVTNKPVWDLEQRRILKGIKYLKNSVVEKGFRKTDVIFPRKGRVFNSENQMPAGPEAGYGHSSPPLSEGNTFPDPSADA